MHSLKFYFILYFIFLLDQLSSSSYFPFLILKRIDFFFFTLVVLSDDDGLLKLRYYPHLFVSTIKNRSGILVRAPDILSHIFTLNLKVEKIEKPKLKG